MFSRFNDLKLGHPLDSCAPEFRQRIDQINLFQASESELGELFAAAPNQECAAFITGIGEAKEYFNALFPQSSS